MLSFKNKEKWKAQGKSQREQQNPRVLELNETKQGENGKRKLKQEKGKNRRNSTSWWKFSGKDHNVNNYAVSYLSEISLDLFLLLFTTLYLQTALYHISITLKWQNYQVRLLKDRRSNQIYQMNKQMLLKHTSAHVHYTAMC